VGTEIELKFRLPARSMAALAKGQLPGARSGHAERTRLVSTYFDTAKYKLRRHGLSLRIREAHGKRLQTVKSARSEPIGRGEWEAEIDSPSPDIARASDSPLRKFGARKLKRKLKPAFKTLVRRTTLPLRSGKSEIELAIDRGRIAAGARHCRIAEVEIELKRGRPAELFRLARRLEHRMAAELYLASKAQRGYALDEGKDDPVHFAEPIRLPRDIPAIDAFKVIARSTIRHFAGNADAVRAREAEGVHQMRVGLRRTRAAISIFADMLPGRRTERVKSELKWLTNELAPARELDVFMRKKVTPATRRSISKRGARVLKKQFAARRRRAFARAAAAISSSRYRLLLIDIHEWLETQIQARTEIARTAVDRFAGGVLDHRLRKIRKDGKQLQALSAHDRHKLRIKIKKIRYAIEFFESLHAGRKRKHLAQLSGHLKGLQGALGSLNDLAAHRGMAADAALGAPRAHRRARAFVAGVLLGEEEETAKPLLKDAAKAIKQLGKTP
jgi:inorganic triphosphatase YgiF